MDKGIKIWLTYKCESKKKKNATNIKNMIRV